MNQRIQELAREAGITTNLDTDYFEKHINRWVDYYSEKFAELIVRECIMVVEDSEGYSQYFPHVAKNIKKHFGVEE